MKKFKLLTFTATLLLSQMVGYATVTDLANNLGATWGADASFSGTDQWLAQKFNSANPDSTITLSSITLNLHQTGSGSGTFFVRLYSSSGGAPGSSLFSLASGQSIAGLLTGQGDNWTLGSLSVNLNPSTDYFIVVGQEATSSGLLWGRDTSGSIGQRFVGNDTSWNSLANSSRMQVQADVTPVPEPAGWVAGGLAAAFAFGQTGWRFIRRRQKK